MKTASKNGCKGKYQNWFLLFGVAVLAVMLTQLNYAEVGQGVAHAGYWFLAVVALWAFLYLFNAATWWLIVHQHEPKVSFWWLYKITVSGFALNYATPGGLMGGEPYRIMELTPVVGAERATSSVILYVMTHIFSHFWFWLLAVPLFLCVKDVDVVTAVLLTAVTLFCLLGIWFFVMGYRKGLAVRAMNLLRRLPLVGNRAQTFVLNHRQQLDNIDRQIASMHRQSPRRFVTCVLLELACRVCSAAEIYFILLVLMPAPSYADCLLVLAFTSLFANMLFFMPLQLGGREGGFLMSVAGVGLSASAGIFVALLVRLRELIWTAIGLLLIKLPLKPR